MVGSWAKTRAVHLVALTAAMLAVQRVEMMVALLVAKWVAESVER